MSLGGLATHLSNLPNWGTTILNDASYDLAAGPPNMTEGSSREAILAFFEESVKTTRRSLDKTDAELNTRWTLRRGDQEMFSMPRAAGVPDASCCTTSSIIAGS